MTGAATVDPYAHKFGMRDPACDEVAESQRVDLTMACRSIRRVECGARSVIDVLVVEKDDHAPRRGVTHLRAPECRERKNPAGSGRPERRGGLCSVYLIAAARQLRRGRERLTIPAGARSGTAWTMEGEEPAARMPRVWPAFAIGSRWTMAALG